MTDQHTVGFEGVRLIRLPAGRAEGFVWLTFVGIGEALQFTRDPEGSWRIRDFVSVAWPSGARAEIVGAGHPAMVKSSRST